MAVAPAATNPDGIAAAKAHTRQGSALYDLGRYTDANAEFERAYLIEQDPALLYNMGQCHRKLGNADEAVHFFRTYLRRSPSGPFAGAAEKRIHEIEAESAAKPKK
jgi:tetratricopeptide (TPR) repeat protein